LEMMVHHAVTISLLIISFLTNFFRVGVVILLIHDVSDILLETAKVLNYTAKPLSHQWMKPIIADGAFVVFAVTFIVTRLVIYPGFVLKSVFGDGYQEFKVGWLGAYIYSTLLLSLQALHIFWTYLIVKMIVRLVVWGIVEDVRSEEEEEEEAKKKD